MPDWTLDLGSAMPVWIEFKYERLPNICFNCGRFDHESRLCLNENSGFGNIKFGPWIRAEHPLVERLSRRQSSKFNRKTASSDDINQTPVDSVVPPKRHNVSIAESTKIRDSTDAKQFNKTVISDKYGGIPQDFEYHTLLENNSPQSITQPKSLIHDFLNPILFIPNPTKAAPNLKDLCYRCTKIRNLNRLSAQKGRLTRETVLKRRQGKFIFQTTHL